MLLSIHPSKPPRISSDDLRSPITAQRQELCLNGTCEFRMYKLRPIGKVTDLLTLSQSDKPQVCRAFKQGSDLRTAPVLTLEAGRLGVADQSRLDRDPTSV